MKRYIERTYQQSLSTSDQLPVGVDQAKVKEAAGTIPFVVGRLQEGRTKMVVLWRVI